MPYGAVLFDLDGTLVDTIDHWIDAYLVTLGDFGVALDRPTFLHTIYRRNRALADVMADHGVDDPARFRAARDARYHGLLAAGTNLLPGAAAALARLKGRYPLGLVTAAWTSYFDILDGTHDLRGHFDTVVTTDDTAGRGKPDPYGLLLAAERLGVAPEACVYVGDQPFDVEAARRAGMVSCLVPAAHTPPGADADLVLGSLDELLPA